MEYARCDIFHGIADSEVEAMIACFRMRRARFAPGETIRVYGGSRDVGVVVRGAAELVRFDSGGNRTILERMETGGIFGELLAFSAELGDSLEVIAAGECEVLFMDYAHIMKRCEKACRHHSLLVENLFRLMAEQARRLSRRVEVLSQRSIRDKLLCFMECLLLFFGRFGLGRQQGFHGDDVDRGCDLDVGVIPFAQENVVSGGFHDTGIVCEFMAVG